MQSVDQIIQPRWLIPADHDSSIHEDHGVVVDGGKIVQIGPAREISAKFSPREFTILPDHALMPGLVNAHTHMAMTLLRGYADDLPLMEWLNEHIWPAEKKWVDSDFVEVGTNLACAEMIRSGTTCFNDMYFFPDVAARCAEQAGMRACIGMIVIDFPTVWAQNADEYLNKGLALRDQIRHSNLVSAAFAPHAPYTVSDEPLKRIATLSGELDCQVHMHVHETAHEIEESTARYGVRPLERLDSFGLLGPNLVAVHMTQLLPGEIETLAERGVHVVHCPESNLKLASGFCPVADLQAASVNVCIGTDGASSNNDLDMLAETRIASLLAKGVANDPTALDSYDALKAATINGARALGLDKVTGSIEAGKQADMIAIDLAASATQPLYHPVSQIVYSATRSEVTDVWVAGKKLLDNGELTTLDEDRILGLAGEWRARIAGER